MCNAYVRNHLKCDGLGNLIKRHTPHLPNAISLTGYNHKIDILGDMGFGRGGYQALGIPSTEHNEGRLFFPADYVTWPYRTLFFVTNIVSPIPSTSEVFVGA